MKTLIKNITLLLFTVATFCYAQERESIYIRYDEGRKFSNTNETSFAIEPNFFGFANRIEAFYYDPSKNKKTKIPFCKIKDKLVTKEQANIKAEKLIEERVKKFEKVGLGAYVIWNLPIYFNSFFKQVYIYHTQTETLYEVSWYSNR